MKKIVLLILFVGVAYGQACCSAGTPFIGSIEMSNPGSKWLNINLMYNHNLLEDLYEGKTKVNEDLRERISRSFLLQLDYGLTSRISTSVMFSFIRQERTITESDGNKNSVETSGIGDILVLLKYNLLQFDLFNKWELTAGAGVKFPVGNSELKSNGILLPADLQPGSGSYDFLLNLYGSKRYIFEMPFHSYFSLSYKINGENNRFGEGQNYRFGNEFISTVGVIYETGNVVSVALEGKYRHTARDEFLNQNLENTGGDWLYIKPGINISVTGDLLVKLASELPVYRNLDGIQLTTTYLFSTQVQYALSLN